MADTTANPTREPLGIGQIAGDTFSIFFGNFLYVILLSLVPTFVIIAAALVLGLRYFMDPTALQNLTAFDIAGFVLLGLIAMAAVFFTTALIVRLAYDAKAGYPLRIGSYFLSALPAVIPIVICAIVIMVCAGVISFLVMLPGSLIGGVAAIISIIPTILAALYVFAMWSVVTPAIVVEKAGLGGLGRSLDLTRDYRWACVGALVIMFLCLTLISIVLGLGQLLLQAIGGEIFAMIFSVVFNGVTMAFYGIFTALMYARLREIKEGASVENLADVFA